MCDYVSVGSLTYDVFRKWFDDKYVNEPDYVSRCFIETLNDRTRRYVVKVYRTKTYRTSTYKFNFNKLIRL